MKIIATATNAFWVYILDLSINVQAKKKYFYTLNNENNCRLKKHSVNIYLNGFNSLTFLLAHNLDILNSSSTHSISTTLWCYNRKNNKQQTKTNLFDLEFFFYEIYFFHSLSLCLMMMMCRIVEKVFTLLFFCTSLVFLDSKSFVSFDSFPSLLFLSVWMFLFLVSTPWDFHLITENISWFTQLIY